MASLSPDDKGTLVMVYTQNMLARGEVVTRQGVRVSTWLRTQGVPEYIHLFKPTVLHFGSGVVKATDLCRNLCAGFHGDRFSSGSAGK